MSLIKTDLDTESAITQNPADRHNTNVVLLPITDCGKDLALFEALKLQLIDTLTYARQSNNCLITAFEYTNSLAMDDYARETDNHISFALQTLALLNLPGHKPHPR